MPTITTKDGTEISYNDWGKGQPVVFSHGLPWGTELIRVFNPERVASRALVRKPGGVAMLHQFFHRVAARRGNLWAVYVTASR